MSKLFLLVFVSHRFFLEVRNWETLRGCFCKCKTWYVLLHHAQLMCITVLHITIVPWHAFCMPKKTSWYTENTSINLARFRQNLDSESKIQPNELRAFAEKPSSCYYIRSSSPNIPPQTAGGYPDSRRKKSLRNRSRIKKLAQVLAKFLKNLRLLTQISLETALLQFFHHQVRLDESERQRSAASVVEVQIAANQRESLSWIFWICGIFWDIRISLSSNIHSALWMWPTTLRWRYSTGHLPCSRYCQYQPGGFFSISSGFPVLLTQRAQWKVKVYTFSIHKPGDQRSPKV